MATESDQSFQLVVIGGGPGGYAAAFHAADHGMQVAIVEKDPQIGGVCLHRGCIPSKALLHVAKLIHESQESEKWGVSFGKPAVNLEKLRAFKQGVVSKLAGGVTGLGQQRKVTVIQATATFADSNTLSLAKADGSKSTLKFEHAILATGSSPAIPPIFALNDPRVMDSTGALELADIPKRLLVVGGGYIGLEMGSVYSAIGSNVVVVELTDGLLPGADRDLVRPLQKRLEADFEAIHLKTKVAKLEPMPVGVRATLEAEAGTRTEMFDRVLVSIGRRPNSKGLGLENTKVKIDEKGFVTVDRQMRTADPSILAIGDIAGEPMLAHKASREARVAVDHLLGHPAEFDNVAIPAVVFTDPELAWCGLTETQAQAQGREVKVVRFPWGASGRAISIDRVDGITKIICDPQDDRILGYGVVGAGAGELIAEGALAIEMAAVARDVSDTIHAHPTLSETLMESAEAIIGQATHMFRPKRK